MSLPFLLAGVGRNASNAIRQYLLHSRKSDAHLKIPITAVIGPVRSTKIIPSEKIWIPDPEK
jgi:hypothetical protein